MKLTKKEVNDYLSKHSLMQIATYGKYPWIATVYYSFDDDLNLYFLSSPKTLHCKQIEKNPKVAVAISNSNQPPNKPKIGLQMWGNAYKVGSAKKTSHALSLWKSSLSIKNPKLTYENMKKGLVSGRMYVIKPKVYKIFNSAKYKDLEEGSEPLLKL